MKLLLARKKRIIYFVLFCVTILLAGWYIFFQYQQLSATQNKVLILSDQEKKLNQQVLTLNKELQALKSEDQFVVNQKNKKEIEAIQNSYKKTVTTYESLLKLKEQGTKTEKLDEQLAKSLSLLAEKNYASAEAVLVTLETQIKKENETLAQKSASVTIPANVPSNNTPPSSGYSRQKVNTEIGEFLVDIISADLNSTRVVVDTASDGDCRDNCPVLSLGDYVSRSGAYAGINGSYFCPATYPSCAGKTNSFDTLLMNKNKVYFNSDNNVYSTVPVAAFGSGWARFMGRSLDWGRDTGVDAVIANQPLLLSGGNIAFGGDGDPKKGSKGARSFIGNKGSTVYIGVTHNATVAENAYVLKALGLENGLNLDSGGSTALWSGGYKAGPGRNIPNAILFIRK